MPESTVQAVARSLSQDVKSLAVVSNNVSNMHTPGFQRLLATPDLEGGNGVRETAIQQDGALAQTARPFDLALRGPGYFVVERDGRMLLTRAGAFHVNAQGQLVTATNDVVQGDTGPIVVQPGDIRVDGKGGLWKGVQQFDALQIVSVADAGGLEPQGRGAYAYDGAMAEWQGAVVQGALEQANVDAADEMVRLMQTTRHMESVQRVISIYDRMLDTGINRLGEN